MRLTNTGSGFLAAARRWQGSVLFLAAGLIVMAGHHLDAADSFLPRWHASSSSLNDCQVAVEARRRVMADPVLAAFNIGVTVADGAATVWGAVPAPEIAARVRSSLSGVAGISMVVDDLRIDPDSRLWTLRSAMASEVGPPAEKYHTGLASGHPSWEPANFTGTVPALTLNYPSGDPSRAPAVTLLKPTLSDTKLTDQLETLRRSLPRFRDVGVRSVGSVVYLRPYHAPPATVLELAGRISQLPGVSRVLIEESRRPSSLAIP